MPGTSTKGDLYLEIGGKGDNIYQDLEKEKAKAWLARVDLGKLGWSVKWKRRRGEIKFVYVKKGGQARRDT